MMRHNLLTWRVDEADLSIGDAIEVATALDFGDVPEGTRGIITGHEKWFNLWRVDWDYPLALLEFDEIRVVQRISEYEGKDLGGNHFVTFYDSPNGEVKNLYMKIMHPHYDTKEVCSTLITLDVPGSVAFEPEFKYRWTVRDWDKLDISPSFRCGDCDDHGFIQKGKWEQLHPVKWFSKHN